MLLAVKNIFPVTPLCKRGVHPVSDFPEGTFIRITKIQGERELCKRIESMGVVTGSVVTMLQHRGASILVKAGHTRIAFRNCEALQIYGEQFLPAPS